MTETRGEPQSAQQNDDLGGEVVLGRYALRMVPLSEVNRLLAEADALLDEGFKRRHAIVDFEDVKRQYPDQWVAMTTVEDGIGEIVKGRLCATAPDKASLLKKIRHLRKTYPDLVAVPHFTGRFAKTDVAVA